MSRLRLVAPFALVYLLSACASVPLVSMYKLSSLGGHGLEGIDPVQLRVRLSVSPGYEIDVRKANLYLSISEAEGGSRELSLSLAVIERSTVTRSTGLFSGKVAAPTHILKLTPESAKDLAALKSRLASKNTGKRTFSVSAPFLKVPKDSNSVSSWSDIRFTGDTDWIVLTSGAKLKTKKTT